MLKKTTDSAARDAFHNFGLALSAAFGAVLAIITYQDDGKNYWLFISGFCLLASGLMSYLTVKSLLISIKEFLTKRNSENNKQLKP